MKNSPQFDGLYGQAQAPIDAEYLFSELLETRSRSFHWVIKPHWHAHLVQVFWLTTGQVTLQEAARQRNLTAPVLLLVPPTAVHGFVYSSDARGRILTLSSALVDNLFPDTSPLAPLFGGVQCLTAFEALYSAELVEDLLAEINRELFDHHPEKQRMLRVCLQRLFLVLLRIWHQHEAREALPATHARRYFQQFQLRVKLAGTTHSVAQLADELAITPMHLNRICREVAGKSSSRLVQEHILQEARNYLTFTAYSVSEIAYQLHFQYPNYFARFFKKHTGLTPSEYRANQQAT